MLLELGLPLSWAILAFGVAYAAYLAIDRLLLSPLSHIPGPKIAALTGWYETYFDVFLPARYVFKMKEMHEKYGPIVRINPRQISISDCDYLDVIYEGSSDSKRDKDYEMVKAMRFNSSVGGAWQHELHKKRRQSLNNFFSQGMVLKFEPKLIVKAQQLHELFKTAQAGRTINLSDTYFAFASDVANQFVFGHNQNVLSSMTRARAMRINVSKALQGAKINLNFSWIRNLIMLLPRPIGKHFAPAGAADMIRFRNGIRKDIEKTIEEEQSEKDLGKSADPSIFRELLRNPALPPSEKAVSRLEDEGTLMIMAGTESPAKSITIAHFYLISQPKLMRKLRSELGDTNPSTLAELLRLPYLNAIAIEANRLSFGLTGRNSRVARETLTYTNTQTQKSYKIPPGTPMSTSTLLSHTDESHFPDPWTFNPDRWLGQAGQSRRKYMLSLGKGTRMCIGMNLAQAELVVAIAEMVRWNMSLWETDKSDVKFRHDWHVAHPRVGSQGVRVKVLSEVQIGA